MSLQADLLDIDRYVKIVSLEIISMLITMAFDDDREFLDAVDRVISPKIEELLDAIAQEGDAE
jgi:hypothetical protein